jgi:glycine/D-amino acid oxidase-like deaminating enzyme/nitrite reductase/ring-hydroxylating ferredoxin subunit
MPFHPEQSRSLWDEVTHLRFSPLTNDTTCEICVIGGGITGLSIAYQLLREGLKVVVIERDQIGDHETGHTSAHISHALDDGFQKLRSLHGVHGLRLALESHFRAINEIENICNENEIACDFERVNGYLFLDHNHSRDYLIQEFNCLIEAGEANAELCDRTPLNHLDLGPCIQFSRQAQFHPIKYLNGLAQTIEGLGGRIFTQTAAQKVVGGKNAHVMTERGQIISANTIVVATNVPFNDLVVMHTKIIAYRSYVLGTRIPAGLFPKGLFWDTADPYHYVRSVVRPNGDEILLVGGQDHRTGQAEHPEEAYVKLAQWTLEKLQIKPEVVSRWSGQIIEPVDALAYIGKNPADDENILIATGDSGHGLTHGTIASLLLTDLILKRPNPCAALYNPSRLRLRGLETYVEENLNVATQYSDWLSPGDVASSEDIAPGHGAILRDGFSKIAAYRDDHGELHTFSATCPHLKAIVHWNSAEGTWDCPCHGSRFSRNGKVINGPAITGLTRIDPSTAEKHAIITSDTGDPDFSPTPDLV